MMGCKLFFILSLCFVLNNDIGNNDVIVNGFSPTPRIRTNQPQQRALVSSILQAGESSKEEGAGKEKQRRRQQIDLKHVMASTLLVTSLVTNTISFGGNNLAANAISPIDNDVDAVEKVVDDLKLAGNDPTKIFNVYESIAEIISEGKGVGGIVNYKGVQLDRGYVADEDTSIYNPGLTLLTETEKNTIVGSIIKSRKLGLSSRNWPENNELAFKEIKQKLDPYSMTELRGYLSIVPYYSAFLYLGVLGIQQFIARPNKNQDIFTISYGVAVFALLLPAIGLVLAGV